MNTNYLNKKNKLTIIFILVLVFMLTALFINYFKIKERENLYSDFKYFQLINNYFTQYSDKEIDKILNSKDIEEKLISFHNEISKDTRLNNEKINYIELGLQVFRSIESYYDGSKELVNGYGKTKDLSNQLLEINGEEVYMTPFNSVQISDEFQEIFFKNKIFSQEDFLQNENRVPLILGKDFKGTFEIGDTLRFTLVGTEVLEGEIKGFFDADKEIIEEKMYNFLDWIDFNKSIIMPIFESLDYNYIKENFTDESFIRNYYLFVKNNNFVYIDDVKDFYKANEYLDSISEKYNLDYDIIGYKKYSILDDLIN